MTIPPEIKEYVEDRLYKKQVEDSKVMSNFIADWLERDEKSKKEIEKKINGLEKKLDDLANVIQPVNWEKLQEVISTANGFTAVKNVFTGLGSFILALGALGAGITWLITSLIK